jgi:hypothetical protein
VLIVDNLTFLRDEMEKANSALPLMKELKALKNKYGLSILVLAHTPKRDLSKPIGRNDISGSKMLVNFCDSAFAIGESANGVGIRYFKQIKQRNCEQMYGSENIVVCRLDKQSNFLGFDFLEYGVESDYLRVYSADEEKDLNAEIVTLKTASPDLSFRDIAKRLNTNHTRVRRVLAKENK